MFLLELPTYTEKYFTIPSVHMGLHFVLLNLILGLLLFKVIHFFYDLLLFNQPILSFDLPQIFIAQADLFGAKVTSLTNGREILKKDMQCKHRVNLRIYHSFV